MAENHLDIMLCVHMRADAMPKDLVTVDKLLHVGFTDAATGREREFVITIDGKIEGDMTAMEAAQVWYSALRGVPRSDHPRSVESEKTDGWDSYRAMEGDKP